MENALKQEQQQQPHLSLVENTDVNIHVATFDDIRGFIYVSSHKLSHAFFDGKVHPKAEAKAMNNEIHRISQVIGITPGLIIGIFTLAAIALSPIFN